VPFNSFILQGLQISKSQRLQPKNSRFLAVF